MTRQEILSSIVETGILPVVRAISAEQALRAAEAIYRGGITTLEITMTVPGAIHVMEKVADRLGDKVLLGAGTVLDGETARAALLAGAQFLVSPALRTSVIEVARRYSKPVLPGALTPTEVLAAWEAGADLVKVFPCGSVGGELVEAHALATGKLDIIEDNARKFLDCVRMARATNSHRATA